MKLLAEKDPGLLRQLEVADARLEVLVFYAAALSVQLFGVTAVLTRVDGSREQTTHFHGAGAPASPHEVRPTRAADLRTRGLLDDDQAETWQNAINARVQYSPAGARRRFDAALYETQTKMLAHGRDPKLPPVVPHLHLQVPPWSSRASLPIVRLWTLGVGSE